MWGQDAWLKEGLHGSSGGNMIVNLVKTSAFGNPFIIYFPFIFIETVSDYLITSYRSVASLYQWKFCSDFWSDKWTAPPFIFTAGLGGHSPIVFPFINPGKQNNWAKNICSDVMS